MKTVVLVRHAKSSWAHPQMRDFDRPLNDRGLNDAPMMGKLMHDLGLIPDLILSSTAERAHTTAYLFAQQLQIDPETIALRDELYHAPPATFYEVLQQLNDQFNTVYVFAHNNGISEFAALQEVALIDEMPTCAVFAFQVMTDRWIDFKNAPKKFLLFDRPKNH